MFSNVVTFPYQPSTEYEPLHDDSSDEYESASETTPCEPSERTSLPSEDPALLHPHSEKWRNLIAYWFLGLTNNFAYVVMLSAAHDILSEDFGHINVTMVNAANGSLLDSAEVAETTAVPPSPNPRDCNTLSTGTILLADIIPALVIKMMAPFMGSYIHLRISAVVILCAASFLLVGIATSSSMAIIGVICASASSGLGETTFLAYSAYFHRNVISTWSSGTGGAGLLGSLSYAALTSLGLTTRQTLYVMLIVPVIMTLSFWSLLEHPQTHKCCRNWRRNYISESAEPEPSEHEVLVFENNRNSRLSFDEKLRIIPSLAKYMVPLSSIYVAEYLINQGLSELVYFPKDASWINHSEQYRWYQVLYSIGVLISRSSVNIIYIEKIWILAVLQWINVVIFLTAAIYWWLGTVWIAFILILWEGLLGGCAYVNTYYKLSKEIIPEEQEFALQMTCMSDTLGITLSGFIAIPLHNAICKLPLL